MLECSNWKGGQCLQKESPLQISLQRCTNHQAKEGNQRTYFHRRRARGSAGILCLAASFRNTLGLFPLLCTVHHIILLPPKNTCSTSWHITTHTKCGKMMTHVSQQPSFGSSILCSACNPRANLRWGKFAADDPAALSHLWPPQGWDGTFQERMQLRADGSLYYFVLSSALGKSWNIKQLQYSTII